MKRSIIILSAALLASSVAIAPVSAAVILGLYNTGVKSGGAGWAGGSGAKGGNGADLHWNNDDGNGGQAFTGSPLHPAWAVNNDTSQWLTPSPQGDESYDPSVSGNDVYSLTFDLTGYNPLGASFAGRFMADNQVTSILLNGHVITGSGGAFNGPWTSFSSVAGDFTGGVNTLQFNVLNFAQNGGNPTGLRVEFLSSDAAAVPEPATWALMIGGFALVGASMRRSRRVAHVTA